MAIGRKDFYTEIYLHDNQIKDLVIEKLAVSPSPVEAKIYFNVDDKSLYYSDGTSWIKNGTSNYNPVNKIYLNNIDQYLSTTSNVTFSSITVPIANIGNIKLKNDENLDVDSTTDEIVASIENTYNAVFFDYLVNDGTNFRTGTVMCIQDGTNIEYTDTSTNDIGNTENVSFYVMLENNEVKLYCHTESDNWKIKTFVRGL